MAELRCHGNTSSARGIMGNNFTLSQKSERSWNENGGRNAMFWRKKPERKFLRILLRSEFNIISCLGLISVCSMSSVALWVKPDAFDFGAIHAPLPPKLTLHVSWSCKDVLVYFFEITFVWKRFVAYLFFIISCLKHIFLFRLPKIYLLFTLLYMQLQYTM